MIIPGILELNPQDALNKIELIKGVAPKVQLDIADGELVSGKTFLELDFLNSLTQTNPIHLQLHLMVQKPEALLMFLPPIVKEVCIQAEAFMYKPLCMEAFDDVLKAKKIRVGLSFNHTTPFEDFSDCIIKCDFVQFMTINPGAQGRPFILESLDKIARFKEKYPDVPLQIDGGLARDTIPMVVEAGADDLIVGSAIFKSEDPIKSYQTFVLQYDHARANHLTGRKLYTFRDETYLKEN